MALGEACGLQSRLTSLPERALSTRLKGFWEKLGAEAVGDREIWSSDSHSMESVMNSNWRSNSLWQKRKKAFLKSLKDLTNRAVRFHWLLPGHLPLTKLTFYCAILCCIFKRHHLFDTGLERTILTNVLWLKWINSRINIGEIWVLQWSTKSHRCFQCCLVIWA